MAEQTPKIVVETNPNETAQTQVNSIRERKNSWSKPAHPSVTGRRASVAEKPILLGEERSVKLTPLPVVHTVNPTNQLNNINNQPSNVNNTTNQPIVNASQPTTPADQTNVNNSQVV